MGMFNGNARLVILKSVIIHSGFRSKVLLRDMTRYFVELTVFKWSFIFFISNSFNLLILNDVKSGVSESHFVILFNILSVEFWCLAG